MNKLSKEKQQQLILVAMGAVAVLVLLWFFAVDPLIKGRKAKLAKAKETETALESAKRLVAEKGKIGEELKAKTDTLDKMEAKMAAGDLNSWMRDLLIEFRQQRPPDFPDMPNVSPPTVVGVGVFPDFPFKAAMYKLEGTAHYHNFGAFLASLENAYPYMRVQNIELSPEGGGTSDDREKLSFRMEIVALIKPVPGAPAEKK